MQNQKLTLTILSALAVGTFSITGTAAAASDQPTDLGETVVTAERVPSQNMNTPADVTVISAAEIEANHYADVAEALNHVDSIVMTNGNSGNDQVVRINGEERVVVLVDGERLNDDQGSITRAGATLTRIPSVKDIERIEVVKGAGSALYGSDAIGGVINIITKQAKENKTQVDLNTGSWHTHNYELYNQGSEKGLSWTLAAGIQKQGFFDYKDQQGDSKRMPSSDYSNNGLSLNLRQQIADDQSLSLRYAHRTMDGNTYFNFSPSSPQRQIMNDVSLTYRFKEDTKLPGYLRYFNHYKDVDFGGDFHTRLQGIDYQDGWRLDDNNKLIAGAEWHQSSSSNEKKSYADKKVTTTALYLQDSMRLADKWVFIPGVRMDHHDAFGTHWSPKAALNYRPEQNTKIYASWGHVFKAPTVDDMYYYSPAGSYGSYSWPAYYGNPNLNPETGHVETVGISHVFAPGTSLSLNYTNSKLHDAIDWYKGTDGDWYVTNFAQEKKHALDLSWKQRLSEQWSYDLGYTYTHTETDDTNSSSTAKYLKYNSMPNAYRIGLHYHEGAWKANLTSRMGTGLDKATYGDNRFAIFDFNTSYAATEQLTIYAKAMNFTNQAYSRYVGWQYPAPGRFFQIGATYAF